MQRFSLIFALVASVIAQAAVYTDPKSGITFSSWSRTGFTFGLAMPPNATTDFIGQITAQNWAKWGGVSLKPAMVGPLLLVSYPNGNAITSSIRIATRKGNPPLYEGAAKVIPIEGGNYVNETHWVSTFLCSRCIGELSFNAAEAEGKLGWAAGMGGVVDPANPGSRVGMHMGTQGIYALDLAAAKSVKYSTWAAMAKA